MCPQHRCLGSQAQLLQRLLQQQQAAPCPGRPSCPPHLQVLSQRPRLAVHLRHQAQPGTQLVVGGARRHGPQHRIHRRLDLQARAGSTLERQLVMHA